MTLLTWIALSLLLVLAETVSTEPQCDANHTKLLLMVDVRHDPSLTVTRIKNIATYFVSRVKDGLIKTLDVSLVDPFQEKTLFNLTSVTSSLELSSALDQIKLTYVNSDGYAEFSYTESQLFLAFDFAEKKVIDEIHETVEVKKYIVVFLSRCFGICKGFNGFHFTYFLLKLILLFDMPLNEEIDLYNKEHKYKGDNVVFINSNYDFRVYNPVIWVLCRDCHIGMTKYIWSRKRVSCYSMKLLDKAISWLKAARMCESEKSSLPAIETEDELQFLGELLKRNAIKTHYLNASMITNTVVVNVGIIRKRGFQHNNFVWSNLRPFSIEAVLEMSEYNRKRCVAATYYFKTKHHTKEFRWETVNCHQPISKILVCEMEGESSLNSFEEIGKILETSPRRHNGNTYSMLELLVKVNNLMLNEWEGMFSCHDDYETIVIYSFVCDGARDCYNGRDEQYCQTIPRAKKSEILCVTGTAIGNHTTTTYIPSVARCNMIQDCPDNSDEQGCDGCLGRQCEDRTCVPSHWLSRDREKCHLFIGTNRNWYLNVSYPCKGQCSGLVNFYHEITFCDVNIQNSSTFHDNTKNFEWAPKCLYLRGSDGSTTGCHNNRHLRDCRPFQCPEGFLKCPDSYCVPVYNFEDELSDCPYGEDEIDIGYDLINEIENTVKCLESDIFIHLVHLCDGVPQCPYGKDESCCNMTCPPGFYCNGQAVGVVNHALVPELKSLYTLDVKTKYLNLSGIDLSNLRENFILENLLEVHASNCNISKVQNITNILLTNKKIYTLNLSFNKIEIIIGFELSLNNLQFLNLSNNRNLKVINEYSIMSPVLHTIDLSFTEISVFKLYVLKRYKSIRSINLFETNIVQFDSLLNIKRLEYFNLQKTLLSTENITRILKDVSVTTSLYVENFKFCCPQISKGGTPKHACHAPPEAFSSCEDLLSDVLKRSLLWVVAGVSLAGNIIVVTYRLFYDRGVFKRGYGVFVTSLSVSDCVMGVYLLIIASTDVHYRDEYVLHESDWRHSYLCQAAGFLSTLSSETSIFFVFLITLDRYLVIRFPFGDHRFTNLGLVICVLFVWIIGFILASVPLMYPEWIIYSSNGMCFGLPLGLSRNLGWHYSFGIFICGNFIMFLFITCGQIFIFRSLLSSKRFKMNNVQSVVRRVQDIKVAKQLFLVVLSNFLCWFPICVLGFLTLTGHEVSPDTYAWLVVFVMPLNAAINPMIYTIPIMYRKWRDFKEGKTVRTQRPVMK